jgi:hypothetical protein
MDRRNGKEVWKKRREQDEGEKKGVMTGQYKRIIFSKGIKFLFFRKSQLVMGYSGSCMCFTSVIKENV